MQLLTPANLLHRLPENDNWTAQSKRSVARLWPYFLLSEDPQRRLDAREVSTLAHQVSLVRHILENDHLRRVLIADEVGLGKTVEVGLLVKELLEAKAGMRLLYLAPARLVNNVRREFDKLRLSFRQWTAMDADARLNDPRVIASIHRAVHPRHRQEILKAEPYDVLIVDECHHLTDWAPGGGDPKEMYRLVRDIIARQSPEARVLLLSGTPHQGHVNRFENLLELLRKKEESPDSLNGRVIYRTKDEIRDWTGNLLFPRRIVNQPTVVDLGPHYKQWICNIHEFFQPRRTGSDDPQFRRRAAGWRCAQALQWAASSPQAGLGFLVRQAIRGGAQLYDVPLTECLCALRPYRGGRENEPVPCLYDRLVDEIGRQRDVGDVDDIDDDSGLLEESSAEISALCQLLRDGLEIVNSSKDEKWELIMDHILCPAGEEKVVLFAQPIETVTSLARYLYRTTGQKPAMIIGGQSDAEREAVVSSFWRPDGPRFLVSSRAGGEGINLQIARRLVHIDVPWNPMDMEQRVGRIHRFGSRRNVIVDTVVVKDTREAHAYRIARDKLQIIASTLVEPERFEAVFSRVMCLMPPEGLQDVLMHQPVAPLTHEDEDSIGCMVREGFKKWSEFHEKFSEQERQIRALDPGLATWADVSQFLRTYGRAETADGFVSQRFEIHEGNVEPVELPADVLRLANGDSYACGDLGGMPAYGPHGQTARQMGLNLAPVQEVLRRLAFPESPTGAAHLRLPSAVDLFVSASENMFGVLVFHRHTLKTDPNTGWSEVGQALRWYVLGHEAKPVELAQEQRRRMFAALCEGTVRVKPAQAEVLTNELAHWEAELCDELRRPTAHELETGVRHAVLPLFAAVIEIG